MEGMRARVPKNKKAKKQFGRRTRFLPLSNTPPSPTTNHIRKFPLTLHGGNTIISDATISYDARTGSEICTTHHTHTTHATPHLVADPISALPLQWSQRQSSVAVNAPGGRNSKEKEGKISNALHYLSLSSRLKRRHATSAPDCNIGPPRDGETPRATTRPQASPSTPSALFPSLHHSILPSSVLFSLAVLAPEVTAGVGLSPLCVCLQVRSFNACNACKHCMQGHLFFVAPFLPLAP